MQKCKEGKIAIDGRCKEVTNITISARRWFDSKWGNTYHSVEVYANGKLIGENPFAYGYDEAYLQTAHEILEKNGLFSYKRTKKLVEVKDKQGKHLYDTQQEGLNKEDSWHKFRMDMREHREKYVVIVSDVSRKKDL